ncbi:1-acyl-sn-glycerol-3-phosphate acyltransferase [Algoriphagus sp. H41]|uniref:1-acyl-sn-glycerol-3-phosphate acyltransferase n=1 Tax=Algoriphagus oliviformis TaxID=2811231 RepID=A0ABS3C0D1_9BACT|nr:1-acyl-sn-glycerol-3-phosphate acyltransferase [Algoriphagus oliviformis]MBN7810577.1 1-acyl-sn-glycerol-3-phosphate acyltransferase [Algoriphagus oliviformis]
MSKKFIDIEKAIRSKNPKLLKWMPGFLLGYVKRVTHEEWLNSIVNKHPNKKGLDFADALISEFGMDVRLIGGENIPKTGGVILASNHPLGGMDGIAFMHAIGKVRPDVRFLVNDLLMSFDNFEPIFVPVNKHGANSKLANQRIEEAYANGHAVLIFPAGLVSRKQEGEIRDLQWKKSFISKAKKYKLDILPCHIGGRNSEFFYNLANWRKKIGIKANIEMFWLVDEMYKQRGKKVEIRIGKPLSPDFFTPEKTEMQWAEYMKGLVYKLGEGHV